MNHSPAVTTDFARHIAKETIASAIGSAVVSAGFYFALFAGIDPVATGAPHYFALDFIPQSVVASFMSVLIPGLLMRRAISGGKLASAMPTVPGVLKISALFALLGAAMAAGMIGLIALLDIAQLNAMAALTLKVGYGVVIGVVITPLALRRLLKKA